ncbi:MAG TPA: indole-3-glycerol phosphate synthase TrpC [Candidatus Merdisoma merdipullorum]|nr:indole-3-glycerol phosphate synthase TrpC [Candidatus Merdisoma merdipullorum]
MNILNEIAKKTRERVMKEKQELPLSRLRAQTEEIMKNKPSMESESADCRSFPFRKALASPGMSYICEVKKASPSRGLIAPEFPYLDIAKEYEAAGASAISCLTEPFYFLGSDRYLKEISGNVRIPTLRKDFTVDEYMIYQAKALGASAVLLICAILDDAELRSYRELSEELGLDSLMEAHDAKELERALKAGARLVGVNNRDLRTFRVDTKNSIRLRRLVPSDVLFVSESGIRTAEDIQALRENGVDAVLIGETLMRSADKRAALEALNGERL